MPPAEKAAPAGEPDLSRPLPVAQGGTAITGTVRFTGKAPAPQALRYPATPPCPAGLVDESLVVNGGGLANAVVHIKGGLPGPFAPPPGPVVLDQVGCRYRPHVVHATVGQAVEVRNGDGTLHNVHALAGPSTVFNRVQVNQHSPPIEWRAGQVQPGTALHLRCDVHPWMNAYVYVDEHPFGAVSGPDGRFRIEHVPDGRYVIEAWHERLGTKIAEITIQGGKPAAVDFAYSGNETPTLP